MGFAGTFAGGRRLYAGSVLVLSLAMASIVAPVLADDPLDDYKLAVGFYKKEQWKLAAESFEAFLKNHGSHPKAEFARFYYGLTLVKLDDFQRAREILRNFAKDFPKNANIPSAEYWVGHCSYFLDDFEHAEAELERFVSHSPQNPLAQWALPYLADSELRMKKPEPALKHFQQALDAYPQGEMAEDSRFGLARSYEALHKNAEAIREFKELAGNRQGSRAAEAQLSLGELYFKAGDFAAARSALEGFEANFPESPQRGQAQLDLGFACYQLHEYPQALAHFEKAAAVGKYAAEAELWKGLSLKAMGDFPRAVETLQSAYEKHRDDPLAEKLLFQRAVCEDRRGAHDAARTLFLEVADRWPKGPLAAESLHAATLSAVEAGNLPAAESLLARFDRDFAGNRLRFRQEVLKGRILAARNDFAAAVQQFQSIISGSEVESTREQARYHLGFVLQKQGQHAKVLEATEPFLAALKDEQHQEYAGVLVLRGASQLALAKAVLAKARPGDDQAASESAVFCKAAAESAREYREVVSNGPLMAQSLLVSAVAEALARRKDAALAQLESLRREHSKSPEFEQALFELGTIALSWDDPDWAERLFAELIARPTRSRFHLQALADLGWAQYRQKKHLEAAATFARLLAENPGEELAAEAAFQRGVCLEEAGQLAEARAAYAEGARLPGSTDPVFLAGWRLARVLSRLNETAEADAAFEKLLGRFPKRAEADKVLDEWAMVHYRAGDFTRADDIFRRLIREHSTSALADNARLSLAESDLVADRLDAARPQFAALASSATADDTVKQRALYQLMEIERESQHWQDLRKVGGELLDRFPEGQYRRETELRLAEADLNLGEFKSARERLEKLKQLKDAPAVQDAEWFPQVWVLLADVLWRQKEYAAVEATIAEFRGAFPDSQLLYQADELLGKTYKSQAKFAEAREAFERVIKAPDARLSRTAASSQFLLADTYYWEKDYQTALKEYLKVDILYKFPDLQASALYQAGACCEELQQWKQAAKTYDDMLRRFPDSEHAAKGRERLELTKKRLAAN